MSYCESRKHPNCMRDEGVKYCESLDMDLCPLCKKIELETARLEDQEEDD